MSDKVNHSNAFDLVSSWKNTLIHGKKIILIFFLSSTLTGFILHFKLNEKILFKGTHTFELNHEKSAVFTQSLRASFNDLHIDSSATSELKTVELNQYIQSIKTKSVTDPVNRSNRLVNIEVVFYSNKPLIKSYIQFESDRISKLFNIHNIKVAKEFSSNDQPINYGYGVIVLISLLGLFFGIIYSAISYNGYTQKMNQ